MKNNKQAVSDVSDVYYRDFVCDHLDNKYTAQDMYDVMIAINPDSQKTDLKAKTLKVSDDTYKLNMRADYNFRTEKSAGLFVSIQENLIHKGGESLIGTKLDKNDPKKISIGLRETMLVSSSSQSKNEDLISDGLKKRELSKLTSDVFVQTVDAMFDSGLYQMGSKVSNDDKITTREQLNKKGETVARNPALSSSAFLTSTMSENSIDVNPKLNKAFSDQINKSMHGDNGTVDLHNGQILEKNFDRLFDVEKGLNSIANPKVMSVLKNEDEITPKSIQSPDFLARITSMFKTEAPKTQEPETPDKKFKVTYK